MIRKGELRKKTGLSDHAKYVLTRVSSCDPILRERALPIRFVASVACMGGMSFTLNLKPPACDVGTTYGSKFSRGPYQNYATMVLPGQCSGLVLPPVLHLCDI